jgi:acetyl-CoA decarbonylase/synthase complex subunit gamma
MALSGLDIYKLLPKTNCKDCGFTTCLAFAMALAQKKTSLDKCPHVTAQAKAALESASQPPIKLVTIGSGEGRLEVGNETVMYRHEQKFHHPAGVGLLIEDTLSEAQISEALTEIEKLDFERVGQRIGVDLICIKNSSGSKDKFVACAKKVALQTKLNIAISASDPAAAAEAVKICKEARPLLVCEEQSTLDAFLDIAKANDLPLAIPCLSIEDAAAMTAKAKGRGLEKLVINIISGSISGRIQDYTFMRRMALLKGVRELGYPVMAFTAQASADMELCEAVSYIAKYASIVIVKNRDSHFILPLLVARQDIYQDPQKPVQVEPKIYEIGKVAKNSPVLITTNFSITYFTVAGEVESSRVPSYILSCDAEGMSVLTAWAAEKFTAETISAAITRSGLGERVGHKRVIIPGYVSVLSGKLEEVSGWKVSVGPKEASGIPNFLRSIK